MILCFFLLGIQLVTLLDLKIFKVFIVVSIFVNIVICSRIFFFILEIRDKWVVNYIIMHLICILNALIFSMSLFYYWNGRHIVLYSIFTFASLCLTFDGMTFTQFHSIEWDWNLLFALSNIIYVYYKGLMVIVGILFFHTFCNKCQ